MKAVAKAPAELLKLDLGCGINKRAGFVGVDSRKFDNVDVVADLTKKWPWKNGTVEEVNASHVVEHMTAPQRIHFVNELYRVLIPGGKATIATPHWASTRAYGDLTHQWPPVCEFWYYYLSREWRETQAPHNDEYTCDFHATWGYSMNPAFATRNAEFQQFAMANYKESISDMVATLVKK